MTEWAKSLRFDDYKKTLLLAHAGWWSTACIATLRAFDIIPVAFGSMALLTLGLGVTASLGLSRMRLAGTMTQVFLVGAKYGEMSSIPDPLPSGSADELLRHLDSCQICGAAKTVANYCDIGAQLVRFTLEERHGKVKEA